jgi:hypothetical protein
MGRVEEAAKAPTEIRASLRVYGKRTSLKTLKSVTRKKRRNMAVEEEDQPYSLPF